MARRSGEFCASRVFFPRVALRGGAGERRREAHAGPELSPREDHGGDPARESRSLASQRLHARAGGRSRAAPGLRRCICE